MVMVLMTLDRVRDYLGNTAVNPTNLATTTGRSSLNRRTNAIRYSRPASAQFVPQYRSVATPLILTVATNRKIG